MRERSGRKSQGSINNVFSGFIVVVYMYKYSIYLCIYIYMIRSAKRDLMGVKIRNSDLHVFLLNILKALKQILFQSILTSNSRVMTFIYIVYQGSRFPKSTMFTTSVTLFNSSLLFCHDLERYIFFYIVTCYLFFI